MAFGKWCRNNLMLCAALAAAVVTAFFVPPDAAYADYYDWRTLSCLTAVLAVVCAFRNIGVFSFFAQRLLLAFATVRSVVMVLVLITLVGSMLLTNDTALLTFLPLSWFVLAAAGQTKYVALTFILQNCAANLGGMLTPFGNPQNLYLFSYYEIPAAEFFAVMLPPFALSVGLILLCCFLVRKEPLLVAEKELAVNLPKTVVCSLLFILAVAMVLRVVWYPVGLAVIVLVLLFFDRSALKNVDWCLLLTFAAFFTFSGNMARIGAVCDFFGGLLSYGVTLVSALTSQVISNVPAAILLSRFTADYQGLLVGVNIGGAGTLVASLASLITFREFSRCLPKQTGVFLRLFTVISFGFLFILLLVFA